MSAETTSTARRSLLSTDYRTLSYVTGPLIFVQDVKDVAYNEMVAIQMPDESWRSGQVLEVSGSTAVIQVFEGTQGTDIAKTEVRFLEEVAKIDVSIELLGRVLNGTGKPIDGGAPIIPEARLDITGCSHQSVHARAAGRLHRDGHLRDRRTQHTRPRPEAPDLLGLRPARQRAGRPDHPPGPRASRARSSRSSLAPWASPTARQATSCRSSKRQARWSESSSS